MLKLVDESKMRNRILHSLKVSVYKEFINYKRKAKITIQWRNPKDTICIKCSKLTPPVMEQINIMFHLTGCNEKNTRSHM